MMFSGSSVSDTSSALSLPPGLSINSFVGDALEGQYVILRDLGKGNFGTIWLARHILTGVDVAVKVLAKGELGGASIISEVEILKAMDHPNVVKLFQVVETSGHLYVITEFASGGQLLQHIPEGVGLQEEEARILLWQMARALRYCHDKGIAHRDIKAENVLLDGHGHVKLCDFGLGCLFTPGEMLGTICGTPTYWAPELFLEEAYDSTAVDVWSLGVLLFLMLAGRLPFDGATMGGLMEHVLQGKYEFPDHLSASARNLVAQMLEVEPEDRPTLRQVMHHPWLSQVRRQHSHSPPTECVPIYPDPFTVGVMLDLGYDLLDTWRSLKFRQYDATMATYLLLRHQQSQGAGLVVPVRPVHWNFGPRSSSNGSLRVTLPKWRRSSEPCLNSHLEEAPAQQQHREHQWSAERASKTASLPTLGQCSTLEACSPACSRTPLQDPGCRGGRSQREGNRVTHRASRGECAHPTQQAQAGKRDHSQEGKKGWRRMARRIVACVARMCCCCVAAPRTRSTRDNRVAPTTGGQARRGGSKRRVNPGTGNS